MHLATTPRICLKIRSELRQFLHVYASMLPLIADIAHSLCPCPLSMVTQLTLNDWMNSTIIIRYLVTGVAVSTPVKLKNMPGHSGKQTCDFWKASRDRIIFFSLPCRCGHKFGVTLQPCMVADNKYY